MLKWIKCHADELIFGVCLTGIVGAGVLACVETPKAVAAASDKETKIEKFKAAAPYYIAPAAITTLSAAGMVAVLCHKNKKITGLGLALAGAEKAAFEYRDEVKKLIGTKEEAKVQENLTQKQINENPAPKDLKITDDNKTVKVYDRWAGRYFYGNIEEIKKGFLDAYADLMRQGPDEDQYLSLADLYRYIGAPRADCADTLGWNSTDGLSASMFCPVITAALDENDKPVYAFDFNVNPRVNFEYPKGRRR